MAKLYYRYSAMNAGKSTALLQVAHNYEEHGRKVALFTAELDHRYGVGFVTSRLGPQRRSLTFDPSSTSRSTCATRPASSRASSSTRRSS